MSTPPLPPGFELIDDEAPTPAARATAAPDVPPLPPGFEMVAEDSAPADDGGLEIDIVGGTLSTPAQIAAQEAELRDKYGPARPSLFRMDSDFADRADVGAGTMLWAAAKDMFGSRKAVAEYLAEQAGGKVAFAADGDPLVELPDGTRYRVNDDGIDTTDLANVAGNAAAFFLPATWAAKLGQARALGLGGRAALQAGTAGGADAAMQLAVTQEVDPSRVVEAAAGGASGEVIGTGIARGVNAWRASRAAQPAQVNALAQASGIPEPTPQQTTALAQGSRQIAAGADPATVMGQQRYGLQYTQGQRLTEPVEKFRQLSREELLRQSPSAGTQFRAMEEANTGQLETALNTLETNLGGRAGATPAEMTQGAAQRLSAQAEGLSARVADAYQVAGQGGRTAISIDAVRRLPQILRTAVADFAPNETTTPVTAKTLEQMAASVRGLSETEGANVAAVTLKGLETQRRILNNNINAASNNADRAALTKIKREFDAWLDDSIDTALVSGDASALDAIKKARGLRAEFSRRFEGRTDADRFIGGLLDGTRTPEELINVALGASQVSKSSSARFIERLRAAAGDDPAVIGNLRAAHFMRMTRGKDGKPLAMGQIVRNIRETEYNNASVLRALYSEKEWTEVLRLARALEPLVAKGDFARTSGTGERVARMLFQKVGGGLPIVGEMVKGVAELRATIQANRAINAPLKLRAQSAGKSPALSSAVLTEAQR